MNRFSKYIPLAGIGALLFVGMLLWIEVFAQTPRGVVTVAVMDVGQGDSIYIEGPTGEQIVIDGGPDDSLLSQLPKLMPPFDTSLDAIIETHPDADHFTGFIDLLKRYRVGAVIEPGIDKGTESVVTFEKEINAEHIPRYIARRGMTIDLGGGAQLDILSPDTDVTHLNPNVDNDGGIVARLVYGKTSMLFMADTDTTVENQLLMLDSANLKSDILKVGHHGSKTSSGGTFIATVHPTFAAISDGKNNIYHFPAQQTLDTLAKYGAQVLRTDQDGTIVFQSNGEQFIPVEQNH